MNFQRHCYVHLAFIFTLIIPYLCVKNETFVLYVYGNDRAHTHPLLVTT